LSRGEPFLCCAESPYKHPSQPNKGGQPGSQGGHAEQPDGNGDDARRHHQGKVGRQEAAMPAWKRLRNGSSAFEAIEIPEQSRIQAQTDQTHQRRRQQNRHITA
jgi:hypothetical protein